MASAEALTHPQYSVSEWKHEDGLPSTRIYAVAQTSDGFLWLGTADGLVRFDGFQFTQQPIVKDESQPLGQVLALTTLPNSNILYIGTASGILIRFQSGAITRRQFPSSVVALRTPASGEIEATTRSEVWKLNANDLGVLSRSAKAADSSRPLSCDATSLSPGLSSEDLTACYRDERGNSWIGTKSRGLFLQPAGGEVQHFGRLEGLTSEAITDIHEDREGNIWVATANGLNRLKRDKFRTLDFMGLNGGHLPSSVIASGNVLWAVSQAGLMRIAGERAVEVKTPSAIKTLLSDGSGGVEAIGSSQLIHLSQSGDVLWSRALLSPDVALMARGEGDAIWLYGPTAGLTSMTGANAPVSVPLRELRGRSVTSMTAAGSALWLALSDGALLRYADGIETEYMLPGRLHSPIHQIVPWQNDTVWFATDSGLFLFDGTRFLSWNRQAGLPGTRVQWIVIDRERNVWLGCSLGVAKLSLDELMAQAGGKLTRVSYHLFDDGDGILGTPEIRSNSPVATMLDGSFWFTLSEGIAHIDPHHIPVNQLPPPVHILSISSDGRDVPLSAQVTLPAHTRSVEISYAAPSLTDPHKVKFRSILAGFDDRWQEAQGRHSAYYTNLRAGTYSFRVIACNNDGIWNDTGDTLAFSILPAFYQTTSFLVAVTAVLLCLLLVAYKVRVKQRERAFLLESDIRVGERTAIARDLHDNLLQEVLAVGLQLELADAAVEEGQAAKGFIQRALALTRTSMKHGRGTLQILRNDSLTWPEIQQALRESADDVASSAQSRLRLETKGTPRPFSPVAGEQILAIAREAVRNAIAHGANSHVAVLAEFQTRHFVLTISDRGPGISHEGDDTRFGIVGMKERASRIGATLILNDADGHGTQWKLHVPSSVAFRGSSGGASLLQLLRDRFGRHLQ